MTEPAPDEQRLAEYFREIYDTRMRTLPICNARLAVQSEGFRALGNHRIGVLITPWFMNLVMLPGDDEFAHEPSGALLEVTLPQGCVEFTVVAEEEIGRYLSAVLFRSCDGFAGMKMARAVAQDILGQLFAAESDQIGREGHRKMSRRALLGAG